MTCRPIPGLCGRGAAATSLGRSRFLSESTKRHARHRKPIYRTLPSITILRLALIRHSGACHVIQRIPKPTPFGVGESRTRFMSCRQSFRSIGASCSVWMNMAAPVVCAAAVCRVK